MSFDNGSAGRSQVLTYRAAETIRLTRGSYSVGGRDRRGTLRRLLCAARMLIVTGH